MKILMISEFFPTGKDLIFSGGVEIRNLYIAKHLAKKHQVLILTRRLKGSREREKIYGFQVFRVGHSAKYSASLGDLLGRFLFVVAAINYGKKLNFDIIEGTNYLSHLIAKILGMKLNKPTVAWYPDFWLGSWVKNVGIMGIFGEILERINLFFGFDAYIAISKVVAQKLKKHTKSDVKIIPCGIDQKEIRSSIIKFPKPTIICISRLIRYKNLKTLIFAFSHLAVKINEARLIIVGTGPELKNLKNLAKDLQISTKVTFFPNLERKRLINLIALSHIFCLPSLVEGFGISTIEAAATGLPYVVSDIPTHREVTKNGQGGFLVDPKSPLSFSEKFQRLLTDKELYLRKGKEAQNLAKNYSWQDVTRKTELVYRSLIHD